jgi:hypothetical protein
MQCEVSITDMLFPHITLINHAMSTSWLWILLHVRGSVTNSNGFWIGWFDLLTPSFTISLNYNQLQQLTIEDCLPSLHSLLDYECLLSYCDWLGSDLRIGHFYSFRCPMVNTPQLNTQSNSTTEQPSEFSSGWITQCRINYLSSLYNSGTNRIEITISNSSSIVLSLIRCYENVY